MEPHKRPLSPALRECLVTHVLRWGDDRAALRLGVQVEVLPRVMEGAMMPSNVVQGIEEGLIGSGLPVEALCPRHRP